MSWELPHAVLCNWLGQTWVLVKCGDMAGGIGLVFLVSVEQWRQGSPEDGRPGLIPQRAEKTVLKSLYVHPVIWPLTSDLRRSQRPSFCPVRAEYVQDYSFSYVDAGWIRCSDKG